LHLTTFADVTLKKEVAMFIDDTHFEEWMKRLMKRFDEVLLRLGNPPTKDAPIYEGEKLLDDADICLLLHISKRTLQRYRSNKELPYQSIHQKIYYRESDVMEFIRKHFRKRKGRPDPDNIKI
jgi:hypothetical protein